MSERERERVSERRAGDDNNRRRQETSLNGGTGKHKSWEKHAWQNCHGPTLLLENMYHRPTPLLSASLFLFFPPSDHTSAHFSENRRESGHRYPLDPRKFLPRQVEFPKQRTESRDSFFKLPTPAVIPVICLLSRPSNGLFVVFGTAGSSTEPMADGLPCDLDDYSLVKSGRALIFRNISVVRGMECKVIWGVARRLLGVTRFFIFSNLFGRGEKFLAIRVIRIVFVSR